MRSETDVATWLALPIITVPVAHYEEKPMTRKLPCVIALLAAALPALAVCGSKSQGLVLSFKNMFPVSGPFVDPSDIRGIRGDSLEWMINKSIKGQLFANGRLVIKVQGLVQVGNPPNSETEFRAAVSCLTTGTDANSNPVVETANVITSSGFSADASGKANIQAKLNLPSPCVAPVVMILNGNKAEGDFWLAVTGFDPVGGK
jgi:hypothetical protein